MIHHILKCTLHLVKLQNLKTFLAKKGNYVNVISSLECRTKVVAPRPDIKSNLTVNLTFPLQPDCAAIM